MQELDLVEDFYYSLNGVEDIDNKISEYFDLSFFNMDDEQRKIFISKLLPGIMKYDLTPELIAAMYKQFMRLDKYRREEVPQAKVKGSVILECTGSGKKPFRTLNISTPSIIIAVASGAYIIKKGSSSTSSLLGSADLIYSLGFKKYLSAEDKLNLLFRTGFTFIDIGDVIPNFDKIYNGLFFEVHALSYVLAALVTSIRGDKIIYGLSNKGVDISCNAIGTLVPDLDITVYSSSENGVDYFDEIVGNGETLIFKRRKLSYFEEVLHNKSSRNVSPFLIKSPLNKLDSVLLTVDILEHPSDCAYSRIAIKNASFFLKEANIVSSMAEGEKMAKEVLFSKKAYKKLIEIIEVSGGTPSWYEKR